MTNIINAKRINQITTFLKSLNIKSKRFSEIIRTQNISKFKARKNSVIIDSIFGNGLNRPISGTLKSVILRINKLNKIISIDIPSGINGDTGKILGCAVKAHTTLALHAKKIGHTLNPGKKFSGKISVHERGAK